MSRRRTVYEGKAKVLYEGPEPGTLVQYFKDDATAFNNQKRGIITGKGVLNNRISEYLMLRLGEIGIPTHFMRRLNMREQLIKEVEIIPVEVVVRNFAAGSLAERFKLEEGTPLPRSIIEYYYKSDELSDPLVSEEHITAFGWSSYQELDEILNLALRINDYLSGLFTGVGPEAGRLQGRVRPPVGGGGDADRPGRRDQPGQLPPVGQQDQREVRQGPLPPRPRQRAGGLCRDRTAPRYPARGGPARHEGAGDAAVKARVEIGFRPGVLDPEAQAIGQALGSLGFDGVREVRRTKVIELELDGGDAAAPRRR